MTVTPAAVVPNPETPIVGLFLLMRAMVARIRVLLGGLAQEKDITLAAAIELTASSREATIRQSNAGTADIPTAPAYQTGEGAEC